MLQRLKIEKISKGGGVVLEKRFEIPGKAMEFAREGAWVKFNQEKEGDCQIFLNPEEYSDRFETGAATEEERRSVVEDIVATVEMNYAEPLLGTEFQNVRLVPRNSILSFNNPSESES